MFRLFNVLCVCIFLTAACSPTVNTAQSDFTLTDQSSIRYVQALSGTAAEIPAGVTINSLRSAGTYAATIKDPTTGEIIATESFELMKGKKFPPNGKSEFLILSTADGSVWYKVSPRSQMDDRLRAGFNAIRAEAIYTNARPPELEILSIGGQDYLAYKMPYYGRTVSTMALQGATKEEIKFVYESAFRNALYMATEQGIFFRDPNPGNVIELLDNNGNRIGGMLIDFEASGIRQTPTQAAISGMRTRFANWGNYYNIDLDLSVPLSLESLIIQPEVGASIGRVFLKDVLVDYAIPIENLDETAIGRIRKSTIEYIKANGVADDMSIITVEGVNVTVTKRSYASKPIVQTVKKPISTGMMNIVFLLSIGTIEIEGWNGVSINVPYTYDNATTYQEIRESVDYDSLWNQTGTYKDQLVLQALARIGGPDNGLTTALAQKEIGFYLECMLGMSPHDLDLLLREEYHQSVGDVNTIIRDTIQNSDIPLFMKMEFEPVPGVGGYEVKIPLWISAVEDEGTQYMVLWAETYENYFNFDSETIMPVIVLERTGSSGSWNVSYEDTTRLSVGFKISDITPNPAFCNMNSSQNSLEVYCWFE